MSKTSDRINLTNQFLIAMPNMADPTFSGTVVYLCDHTEKGALGLVINRPTDIDLQSLFNRIDLKLEIEPLVHLPVYFGGPVQTERGFVLHEAGEGEPYSSSKSVPGGLAMTTSKDVLEAVASGKGPERFLLTLGHAGWGAGQLEEEISKNGWLTVEADPRIIFDVPAEDRLEAALSLLGVSRSMLSGEAGHA
jgi:putative transcriptional regulator